MLFTRKGDDGTTKIFNSKSGERISKASFQIEALGALDELNSFLGLTKVKSTDVLWSIKDDPVSNVILWIQNCLFTIQAEVAGADKIIGNEKVVELEVMVNLIENELPPIKTFFISGGTELATLLDISRTITRKVERRVVAGIQNKEIKVDPNTLAFLNRLSSLFYALARLSNHKSGINELSPSYD